MLTILTETGQYQYRRGESIRTRWRGREAARQPIMDFVHVSIDPGGGIGITLDYESELELSDETWTRVISASWNAEYDRQRTATIDRLAAERDAKEAAAKAAP